MKKRLILTICTAIMLIVMMIPLTVGASAGSDVQIECTVTAQTETSVTIDVSVTNNPGFMYLELTKDFPSEFSLKSISNGSLISDLTKGTKYIWIADEDVTSVGTLCTLVFSIPEGTAPGNYTVSLGVGMCGNYDEQNVGVSISSCTVTVACKHNFTKEDTSAVYLKSEATCTSPAIYYKSCATCGEKGTATFEYGSIAPHSYTKQVTTDAYKKSDASCTAKAVYYYCCATCDAKGTTTFEYGTTLSHNYTRKAVTDTYKKSSATCTDAAVYYYCCATCDAKGTTTYTNGSELGHTGGTATCTAKAECTRCHQSYGSMLEHVYTDQDATATYLKSAATCTSKAVYYKNCATCDKAGTATFEYGSTEPHSYTKQVTTATYLKSAATCTSKAVYYHCCATCDAKGANTYEHGTTLSHNYTRKVVTDTYKKSAATCTDAAVYYYCCATCDAMGTTTYINGSELGHTGGTATCTAKAECTRCHELYGTTLAHIYDQEVAQDEYFASSASCTAKAKYYKSCSCGEKGTVTFEYGEKEAHTYIQKIDDIYLKSKATCIARAVYYESCSVCGVKGTVTFETGDVPSHNYKTTWSSNASAHWHECSKCGDKKDTASHIAGAAATEYTAQTCTVCGYVITPALGHTHNYSTTWSKDADNHWYSCSGCSTPKDKGAHSYKNACDTDCDVCGYVRTTTHSYSTEWSKDAEKHWYECSICGDKKNETVHTPGADATETTDQTCTVCGYVIKEALGHTHNYDTMKNDETNHWNECACGDKEDIAAHTGGTATCMDKAKCSVCNAEYGALAEHNYSEATCAKKATCSVCGAEKGTLADHADKNADEKCDTCGKDMSTTPDQPEIPDENDGLSIGAIVGTVAGSVAVGGIGIFALVWFVIKKKTWVELLAIFKK